MSYRADLLSQDYEGLLATLERLSSLRHEDPADSWVEVVRSAVKEILGTDGAWTVLREGAFVRHIAHASGPFAWTDRPLRLGESVAGWVVEHGRPSVMEDVYTDARAPSELSGSAAVKSIAIVPMGLPRPLGALGAYWSIQHNPTGREVLVLQRLATMAARAVLDARRDAESLRTIRLREELVAAAAHDMRNTLNLVLGRTSMFRSHLARTETIEAFSRIECLVRDAATLLDSLLDSTRLASGELHLKREVVDLNRVIKLVAERLDGELARTGSSLVVETGGTHVSGLWDPTRLEQILTNLMLNAVKYGAGRRISVRVEDLPASARVSVSDQGIGIAADDRARIFAPFKRAKTGAALPGTGLGLWIVQRLVEAHGGEIQVESTPGRGATFILSLPKRPETAPSGPVGSP